jgi:uncharacterized DUF497 family protein
LEFDWDAFNREKNLTKHQVSQEESEQVFEKGLFLGPIRCDTENRFGLFGQTQKGRTLFVVYTLRNGKIRVISVRDASRQERRNYENHLKKTSTI